MKKLSEQLQSDIPELNLELAKKIIKSYNDWKLKYFNKCCSICLKPLTQEELMEVGLYDFLCCCKEHFEYKNYFQVEKVRQKLGIIINELYDL